MKKIVSLFLVVLMLVGMLPMTLLNASAAETATSTLSVLGNTGTMSGTDSISWTDNKVTFTNNKASSSTAIRTSDSDHYRVYSGSEVVISAPGNITSIVITSSASKYVTPWTNSAGTIGTATADGNDITVVPTTPAATITFSASAQVRLTQVVVTYEVAGGDAECAHANTSVVEAVAATCTTPGYTAGTYCNDCQTYTEGHAVVAATGHSYGDWSIVTAATCTEAGSQTRACANCDATETEDVAALGHNYVDGTCSNCGNVAVMTNYELVTDASSLKAGDQIVLVGANADGTYYVMIPYASGNNLKGEAITAPADGKISLPDTSAAAIVTLGGDSTGWTLFDGAMYIYSAGGTSSNHLKGVAELPADNTGAWTIAIDAEGVATITNVGNNADGARNVIKFNYGNSSALFSNYKTDYTSNVALVYIYRQVSGESEEPEVPACTHEGTTVVDAAVAATCTTTGLTEGSHCSACNEVIVAQEEISALGHSYVDNVCSVCGAEFEGEIDTTDPTGSYQMATEIVVGDTIIIVSKDALMELSGFSTTSTVYGLGTAYTDVPAGTMTWTVEEGTVAGSYAFKNSEGNYLYWSSGNSLKTSATKDAQASWTVTFDGNDVILVNAGTVDVARHVVWNSGSPRFANYKDSSISGYSTYNSIQFYKYVSATACSHSWGEWVVTTAPACTDAGVETATCSLCSATKTQSVAANGHSFAYTETAITCANCDYSAAYTLSTIATAKAAVTIGTDGTVTSDGATYYVKGIVTYVSGKNVYIEDATGAICVYFTAAPSDIALGDEILVWDTMTAYKGLIETSGTTAQEYVKVSSGNTLPSQTVTIAQLLADSTNEYLCERVVIENVTIGTINESGNTALTDADGNTINIYKVSGLSESINENDTVSATVVVSTYNGYQILVNPGTAATDVVETASGEETVVTTVTIAEAKAGTAGEYYQVEGTVTYISGRNVYIQDTTGGIVVYLTASAANTKVGDTVKAYGALKVYNGLIELDGIDETNTEFYSILSSGNSVEAQAVTMADLAADTTNEYLAEKISLTGVYVSHYSYSANYGNVTYYLVDGNGNEISVYRVSVASEAECVAGGSIVNVEAVVSTYNGYQLVTTNDKIVVTGTCAHETTELVNVSEATCTATGYTGDTQCTVCQNYVARGEEIAAHTTETHAAVEPTCTEVGYTEGVWCTVCQKYASGHEEVAAKGHTIVEEVIAPTCTVDGYTRYYCSVCGEEDEVSDTVAATGHSYVDGVCSACGAADPDYEVVLPSGSAELKFSGATLKLEADLTMNVLVNSAVFADGNYTNGRVEISMTDAKTGVVNTVIYTDNYNVNGNYREYVFTGISPRKMNDTITLTVYGTYAGTEYSKTMTYSVATYAYNKLKTSTDTKFLTLLADLLNFGAAHQTYTGYNTENLVNANMTDTQKGYASTGDLTLTNKLNAQYEVIDAPTASFRGASLVLTEKVEIQYIVAVDDLTDVSLKVTADGVTYTVDSSEFVSSSNGYQVSVSFLQAKQMRSDVTATVYRGETAISNTALYSVESYAAAKINGTDANLVALLKMMMYYGDSAAAYFA